MRRRVGAAVCVALCWSSGACSSAVDSRSTIARGLDYVLARQHSRGGIPSEHYGVLRKGAAFGALAAWVLSVQSEAVRTQRRAKLDHLLRFLAEATADPSKLDYPNYTRAYYLRALATLREQPGEGNMRHGKGLIFGK